jgi:hypothetical protein
VSTRAAVRDGDLYAESEGFHWAARAVYSAPRSVGPDSASTTDLVAPQKKRKCRFQTSVRRPQNGTSICTLGSQTSDATLAGEA